MTGHSDLLAKIRTIPDFPKPGILFYDITTLFQDPEGLREAVDRLAAPWRDNPPDFIVGIDARGFILGSAMAYTLGAGLVLVRKKGKLPAQTITVEYELEYGMDELEIHKDAIPTGSTALIVDDLLATGGTASATVDLAAQVGADIVGASFVIEIDGLGGREKLSGIPVQVLLTVGE